MATVPGNKWDSSPAFVAPSGQLLQQVVNHIIYGYSLIENRCLMCIFSRMAGLSLPPWRPLWQQLYQRGLQRLLLLLLASIRGRTQDLFGRSLQCASRMLRKMMLQKPTKFHVQSTHSICTTLRNARQRPGSVAMRGVAMFVEIYSEITNYLPPKLLISDISKD